MEKNKVDFKKGLGHAKGFVDEFKEFISRGSVVDMAVGIIIGTSFTGIVNSLVKDIIMPSVGWLIGGINFEELKYVITPASGDVAEAAIFYGVFIQKIVDFLIIAFVVFLMIKMISVFRRKKKEEVIIEAIIENEPEISQEIKLLSEIRDLLADSKKGL